MREMTAAMIDAPGPPSALQLRTVSVPEPGPGQVRIKVAFVGLTPIDAMLRRERLDWLPVTYPFTPGSEHTGVVESAGEGVDPKWIGRRVLSRLSFGGYAEFSVAAASGLIHLDDRMDLRTGCAYRGCSLTAYHALHAVARLQPGERVLVHSAAGAVGAMAVQIALDAGAHVVGLAGGEAKVAFGQSFGGAVVDYLQPDWAERAIEANSGAKFDVILDGNGGKSAARNFELIAPLGRIVFIGATAGAYPDPVPVEVLVQNSFSVCGMSLRQVENLKGPEPERSVVARITDGRWRVPVSIVRPLSDIAELHQLLEQRALMGRVVIAVDETMR